MIDVLVENVSHYFIKGPKIVEDFSLEMKKGEFIYITGPNGSVKVQLLKFYVELYSLKKEV